MADAKSKKEIERKFLVSMIQAQSILTGELSKQIKYLHIEQGYLRSGKRLRRQSTSNSAEQEYFSVTKLGSGLERVEYDEKKISEYEFLQFWPDTMCSRLEKERALIPHGNLKIELDRYLGDLSGLMVAEVEFDSVEAARTFVAPDWFGLEVTDRQEYSNHSLATSGLPKTELELGINLAINAIRNKFISGSDLVIVAVAGGSASGKTSTVAQQIKAFYNDDALILSMDDYYQGLSFMKLHGIEHWDDPRLVDMESCFSDLVKLKNGESIDKPIYDFKLSEPNGTKVVHPKKIIILEGLFALHEPFSELADIKIFVDASIHSRLLRKLVRDIDRTTLKADEIMNYFFAVLEPAHQEHVQSTLVKADIVISNEYRKSEDQRLPETESQLKFANVNLNIKWPKGSTVEEIGNFSQIDYYCHPQGNELAPETIWRLRIENNDLLSITYKGADQLHSVVRSKSKIEVYKLDELFHNHFFKFYRKTLIVFKHRLTYKLDGVSVSFDLVSVEDSGSMNFVELSGQPAAIEVVANKLKLDLNQAIKESYFELFTKGQNK